MHETDASPNPGSCRAQPRGVGLTCALKLTGGWATVVPSDDFFAAGITGAEWEGRSADERAADAIDWPRLRREALDPLRAGYPLDGTPLISTPDSMQMARTRCRTEVTERQPAPVVILEGRVLGPSRTRRLPGVRRLIDGCLLHRACSTMLTAVQQLVHQRDAGPPPPW